MTNVDTTNQACLTLLCIDINANYVGAVFSLSPFSSGFFFLNFHEIFLL